MVSLTEIIGKTRNYFLEAKKARVRKSIQKYQNPSELASFYCNGATEEQKKYIDDFLENSPDRFKKETRYYIDKMRQK